MKKAVLAYLLAVWALIALGSPAMAHRVNVFAYVQDGKIMGQGFFSGGRKAKNCPVELRGPQGKLLGSTKSNVSGEFVFEAPAKWQRLEVVLNAGEGHRGVFTLAQDAVSAESDHGDNHGGNLSPNQSQSAGQQSSPAGQIMVPSTEIQELVRRAVSQELAPVKAQLARMQAGDQVKVGEVVGAIGYIIGLMGLAAYIRFRRGKGENHAP